MKTIILAGGLGTRISEASHLKPKPMIEIGGKPILWHIMKIYSQHGYGDFVVCCGYKQHIIKEYFANYYLHNSDITFDFANGNEIKLQNNATEPWTVTLADTGLHTLTGGRIRRIRQYVDGEIFMLTYGDGLSNIDIQKLADFHHSHGKIATISVVKPEGRFGVLDIEGDYIRAFREKSDEDVSYINGGFMVFSPQIFDYLGNGTTMLEREPFERLAENGELMAFRHDGFWQCMDTQRDWRNLEDLWEEGAPWKIW
ncbi:MAG: glucose-1-phosphate cytidylyltransferase [Turicibacter sp.]|nr:glucose-1-phosphate cytidylyltransferase [Turicibacter sp.]